MKLRLLLLNFLFFAFINAVLAAPPTYIQTKDGVIVFTDPGFTGSSRPIKPEVISDNIISVTATPGTEIAAAQSLNFRPFLSLRKSMKYRNLLK
jgi:alpha-D-xyloside xylohydrolase